MDFVVTDELEHDQRQSLFKISRQKTGAIEMITFNKTLLLHRQA